MRRREFLTGVAASVPLAGCLSGQSAPGGEAATTTDATTTDSITTNEKPTASPAQVTDDGVTATFRVVDSGRPTEASVDATFDGRDVTVTGTMDPEGCNEPVLDSVSYDQEAATVELVVTTEDQYPTLSVECGNASYDYRSVVTVDDGTPATVVVVHDHNERSDQRFTVER
jgi:hypothetical protein